MANKTDLIKAYLSGWHDARTEKEIQPTQEEALAAFLKRQKPRTRRWRRKPEATQKVLKRSTIFKTSSAKRK